MDRKAAIMFAFSLVVAALCTVAQVLLGVRVVAAIVNTVMIYTLALDVAVFVGAVALLRSDVSAFRDDGEE